MGTVAGFIAERAADTEFHQLMQRTLFKPLGMASAGWGALFQVTPVSAQVALARHRDTETLLAPSDEER